MFSIGLDVEKDSVIEIAVIITNGHLEPIDSGVDWVIRTDKAVLDEMGEWCTDQHGRSGLTQACIDSPHTFQEVSDAVLAYVRHWIPDPRVGVLAGSSVHADARFLHKCMPDLMQHLHYRIVDVSTVKELARRWYPDWYRKADARERTISHRALDDIKASIHELQLYRDELFRKSEGQ